jgi:hypothetical protein
MDLYLACFFIVQPGVVLVAETKLNLMWPITVIPATSENAKGGQLK